ncbi:E3 ubiquitin-protein ligase MARCHF6 [Prorops nasuta]|uniref:E3 ubiquitin-protein ligase MARCHF6 n=1 Tax=Prorops nasuta TaxID=863751 RepID=UPI0034CFE021
MTEDMLGADICRVCRSEGMIDRPLFHPCICTGSIKWIHQECLVEWMRYSRKEYCELCGYRFSFTPIYSPDMPRRLPLRDVVGGLFSCIVTAVKYWLHYTLVAIAWLGFVPLTACRTYRALFSGPIDLVRIMSLPMEILSTENITSDVFHGCFVVTCTLFAFIGLVWLREQILHAGGPDWLERENVQIPPVDNPPQAEQRPLAPEQPQAVPAQEGHDNNNIPRFVREAAIIRWLDQVEEAQGQENNIQRPVESPQRDMESHQENSVSAEEPTIGIFNNQLNSDLRPSTSQNLEAVDQDARFNLTQNLIEKRKQFNVAEREKLLKDEPQSSRAGRDEQETQALSYLTVKQAKLSGSCSSEPGTSDGLGRTEINPQENVLTSFDLSMEKIMYILEDREKKNEPGSSEGSMNHLGQTESFPGQISEFEFERNQESQVQRENVSDAEQQNALTETFHETSHSESQALLDSGSFSRDQDRSEQPIREDQANIAVREDWRGQPGVVPFLLELREQPQNRGIPEPEADRNLEPPVVERQEAVPAELPNAAPDDGWRGPIQNPGQGEAEEVNWNPMEWDRPQEELTWERLLGLDGSLVFLEHVFWVVSLNTLFIMVFAFCPYHIGHFAIAGMGLQEHAAASHFEGLVTTLCGYSVIGVCLVILHTLAALLGFQRSQRVLGLCYVIVKVSLLSVVEIGVLPLICGWWLDICSLAMFDATLRDRESSFRLAPGTSMFIHWLVGMVYIYYFASFILLLREVLRPGVLWFLRNLNDPDFSPIQEMIHLPILTHVRRLVASVIIFGTVILLMLWLPVKLLRWAWPGFLPYTVTVPSEAQVSELSLELLLLQVILPALLEQSHTRTWLKALVRGWCRVVAWLLDLQSYLLRDQADEPGPAVIEEPQHPDLGAAHQALLHREGPPGFQPYVRPLWFPARLIGLLCCVCVSLVIASFIAMTLPVWLGRRVMALWMVGAPAPSPPVLPPTLTGFDGNEAAATLSVRVHEVYTVACGTYVCWAAARGLALAFSWLPRGRQAILDRVKHWALLGVKASIACLLLVGVIPLLFGLLLELVVVVPLRVPLEQNPILFIWQDWALGVLYTKIAIAVTMMGPEWRIRVAIERAYNDGIREMDLKFVVTELAAPVICCFGLALAIPYAIAYGIVPLIVTNLQTQILIARRLYPFLLLVNLIGVVICFQIRQFKKLYEHIKNDKYLVGQRLVNYEHRNKSQQQQQQQQSQRSS